MRIILWAVVAVLLVTKIEGGKGKKNSCKLKGQKLCDLIAAVEQNTKDIELLKNKKECNNGWTKNKNSCYKLFDQEKNWHEAQSSCASYGGFIVQISDSAENSFLSDFTGGGAQFWIGLSDHGDEGNFTWDNAEPVSFTNWHAGEPNDHGHGEDCTTTDSSANLVWNDLPCTHEQRYICEQRLD